MHYGNLTAADRPWIIAHRGASGDYPENTLPAFEAALTCGAHGIELDTLPAADGTFMVIHDRTLDRILNITGAVNERTAEQLTQLDAGSWFDPRFRDARIPRLRDVLARFGRQLTINVEIKPAAYHPANAQIEEQLVALIDELALVDSVVLSAFDHRSLHRIQAIDARCQLAALYVDLPSAAQMDAIKRQLPSLCAFHLNAARCAPDEALRQRVAWAGERPVLLWTVDDVTQMEHFVKQGISGVFTNYPQRMLAASRSGN